MTNQRKHDEQRQYIEDEEEGKEEDMYGDEDDAAAFYIIAQGLILPVYILNYANPHFYVADERDRQYELADIQAQAPVEGH